MAPILAIVTSLLLPVASMAAAIPQEGEDRIIGGSPAREGQFPSTVKLLKDGEQHCGGALIGDRLVLTAAHCVGVAASSLSIRAGSLKWDEGGVTSRVARISRHSSWNMPRMHNDIALLHLASPIKESSVIKYGRPTSSTADPTGSVVSAGWGRTSPTGPGSPNLLFIQTSMIDRASCKRWHASLAETMICSGIRGKAVCKGDSGTPLYDSSKNIIGIVSFGSNVCSNDGVPAVYTKVGAYGNWIKQNSGTGGGQPDQPEGPEEPEEPEVSRF
ncbi:hypothetical protein LOZ53_001802 [Ophidiomyces ophidiicola]|uniref:Uncharacterized protein n=1 Tax=Ophidiomyces ophidiicola TaxID=1387563 RepID=A0ACB8UZM8_9EURO|nr:uncharacterized protein LOZ57_001504 [Ophidiomyces ophidiicola]KAI1907827.1 hypothetical protein LOZ61_005934 [Ophidiomyces ophidiicola]KAI1922102.1 hypothetical protein LOZ60_005873 [Ophidiomyces ophidiicola]KAI1925263.1 hypothetical protein LOZ64_000525 [Ophidiomyces ophidiicola]KAI1948606.1 hypothetical protein LOZ62_002683 [Ophidiomyces ophidiicola]KAI1950955.1 hypothetical protein LOZ57_001504 [Ophidiomyces ophidiicola]